MKRIVLLTTDPMGAHGYRPPADIFRSSGHDLVVAAPDPEQVETPEDAKVLSVSDVDPGDFDALFVPGGPSAKSMGSHENAVDLLRRFIETDKPVFIVDEAVRIALDTEKLRNRSVTGPLYMADDIEEAGAKFLDEDVVVDGTLVSSRSPGELAKFLRTAIDEFPL
jgi:protease I